MISINHEQLQDILDLSYKTHKPFFIWGKTGIGKSQSAKDWCKKNDVILIDQRLSQMDPSDLKGLPNLVDDRTHWFIPSWIPKEDGKKYLILFDELNLAPPQMQASAYELVLDRKCGDTKLPENCAIIAAGNRSEDRAHVFDMASPLANRFLHVELSEPKINPDKLDEGWIKWALDNDLDLRVINYLIKNPSDLFKFDSAIKDKSFPSPRMWESVSTLCKEIGQKDLNKILIVASAGVGEGTAIKFIEFIKLGKKIDLSAIFKDPKNELKKLDSVDMKYALVNELSNYYSLNKDKVKPFVKNLIPVIELIDSEYGIRILQLCYQLGKNKF